MTNENFECSIDANKATELHNLCSRIPGAQFKSYKTSKDTIVIKMTIGDECLVSEKSGVEKAQTLKHQCVAEMYDNAITLIKKHCDGELPKKAPMKPRKHKKVVGLSAEEFIKGKSLWVQFNARWPQVFNKDQVKPLAIGVDKKAIVDNHFTLPEARLFLSYWTKRREYAEAIMSNDTRFNLDGTTSTPLTNRDRIIYRKKSVVGVLPEVKRMANKSNF